MNHIHFKGNKMSDSGNDHAEEWKDPFNREFLGLLSQLLGLFLQSAIEKIVDLGKGYTKESAEQLILRCGLYHGFKDVTTNAVVGALAFARDGKKSGQLAGAAGAVEERSCTDLDDFILSCLMECINIVRRHRPCDSFAEAMWCLFISDLNFWHAVALPRDHLGSVSIQELSRLLEKNSHTKGFHEKYYSERILSDKELTRELPSLNVSRGEISLPPSTTDALEKEIKYWKDWTNEKVMQATRRLVNEKPELKNLRDWKKASPETETQMEHVLSDVRIRRNTADLSLTNLQDKHSALEEAVSASRLKADISDNEVLEASKRVEEAKEKTRSCDQSKVALKEEFSALRSHYSSLLSQLKIARAREEQLEVQRRQEEAEKIKYYEDFIRKKGESERLKVESKAKEIKLKAEAEKLRRSLSSEFASLQVESGGGGTGGFSSSSLQKLEESSSHVTEAAKSVISKFEPDNKKFEKQCIICFDDEARITFLPCGHQVYCSKCSADIESSECPSCRKVIMCRIAARFFDD